MSACISKDTMRNDTQVFLFLIVSIFKTCLRLISSASTSYSLTSSTLILNARKSKDIPLEEKEFLLPAILNDFPKSTFVDHQLFKPSVYQKFKISFLFKFESSIYQNVLPSHSWFKWFRCLFYGTVFSLAEPRKEPNFDCSHFNRVIWNTQKGINTNMIGHIPRAKDHHDLIGLKSDQNTMWVWTAATNNTTQSERVKAAPILFNILATMAVVQPTTPLRHDKEYIPNHRIRKTRHQNRHPRWTSARLKAGTHLTHFPTRSHLNLARSPKGSIFF